MKITKELLLSIILKYFNEKKEMSFYELEKKTGKDIKSLQAWSIQKNQRVQTRNFNTVINALQTKSPYISMIFPNMHCPYWKIMVLSGNMYRKYLMIINHSKP